MKTQFKTFVLKDRSEFAGAIGGLAYTSSLPLDIFTADCTLKDCIKWIGLKSTAEKKRLMHKCDLVLYEINEI